MRTADLIEEQKSVKTPSKRKPHPNSLKNLVAPWPKGKSANPGGRPKNDLSAFLARTIFEENLEEAYKSLTGALLKGNAYVFKELAERGYGKLKETHEHSISVDITQTLLEGRAYAQKLLNGDSDSND